jgi:hypothetical protein
MIATTNAPKHWMLGSISLGIFAMVLLIVALPLGLMLTVGAGACALMIRKSKNDMHTNITAINQKFNDMGVQGKNKIATCVNQWNQTKSIVDQFNNEPIRDIIA